MLDFGELQEFPEMPIWATLLQCTPMEHLKLCHMRITLENRIFTDLINIKLTFNLDVDLG